MRWSAQPNPLARLLSEKRQAGARILDLTESNPTRAGLDYPRQEILAALASPDALVYEPSPSGMLCAREAVADYYGGCVSPDRILLTASTSEAYAFLFKLLTNPGDEVLAPRPSYPLFEFLAELESVRLVHYPLRYDHGWSIDFHGLEEALSARTRAIVIVNPNNPTGSYLKQDELTRLIGYGLPLISDEVFADFDFSADPRRVHSLTQVTDIPTFSLSGLSKISGLPQMKMGWIVVSQPEAHSALELIADTYLSVGTPVQCAASTLLQARYAIQEQIRARTSANLAWLRTRTTGTPVSVLDVEGGWYATLQVPRTRTEEEWVLELLRDHDVLVQPGFFYDFEREAFLVVSLLTPEPTFREGIEKLLSVA